ncbi:MAG: cystathionine beta-synthase [Chloroflexota bacterium]
MTITGNNVHDNILGAIGDTPLVRLNSVIDDLPCTMYAKVEFFNPGGSVKDRIGPGIIEEAERSGRLKPGGTIVESTSGNTGVGLAITATIKGYKTIFVMPDKMSQEKIELLRSFGAEVVVTPTAVEPDDPRSYYKVAARLVEETPNAILANQYHNPMNPQAHYVGTGPELYAQIGDKMTHFIAGMGTGGTISGTGRYLKEQNPTIQIVGVDPIGSILYELHRTGEYTDAESYVVEGIGEDFLPTTMNLDIVDTVVQVNDKECFIMTRRLVREEGLFVGGSCGAAMAGAVKYAREHNLGADDIVVVVLPDSGSRYLSKIFNDNWMRDNGYLERVHRASDVNAAKEQAELISVTPEAVMENVVALLKEHNISQVPVITESGKLQGMVTEVALLNHLLLGDHKHEPGETIASIMDTDPFVVRPNMPLDALLKSFSEHDAAILMNGNERPLGILTKIDILDFLSKQS